ncbi:MAG: META domain-containing protein [Myxococcota bacterium]|nr:META domain-containing protein [Myxococcota bacterium]
MRASSMTLLVLGALAPACDGSDGKAGDAPLVGTVWRWVRATGAEPLEVDRPDRYTLELRNDGRTAVRADCNRGSGSYTTEGQKLRLGPMALTSMACPPGSHFDRFVRSLGSIEAFERKGDRLVLRLRDDAGTIELEASPPVALAGTSWIVRAVNNGREAVVSVAAGTSLDARFGADGNVVGSAGCNRYTAPYTVEGDEIEIGPAAATRMACPPEVMEQESAFLAALGTAATWRIEGERLQLRTEAGALAVDLFSAAASADPRPGVGGLPDPAR